MPKSLFALLIFASHVFSVPPVVDPAVVPAKVNEIVTFTVTVEKGKELGYQVAFPSTSCTFVRLYSDDPSVYQFLVQPKVPGSLGIVFWTVGEKNGKTAYIGGSPTPPIPVPPIPPTPTPTPPTPTPPGPEPGPVPIVEPGFRVLMIYESAELPKLPAAQVAALYSGNVRAYANEKCAKGTDGKTPEFRCWDKDVDTANASPIWQKAMARPRSSVPWVIISNGIAGFEGPLPGTEADLLALMKKFGG